MLAIYKVFLSPLIDYGDKIYGKPHNSSFCENLKSTQYKVALTVTNAKEGTPREKIFQELGLEPLKSRRSFMRFSCMFKLMKNEAPNHLISGFLSTIKPSTQETNMYLSIIAEQIVSTIYFLPVL